MWKFSPRVSQNRNFCVIKNKKLLCFEGFRDLYLKETVGEDQLK